MRRRRGRARLASAGHRWCRRRRRSTPGSPGGSRHERVAAGLVVIPMRNEADSIGSLLDSVLAQDYPADRLEVPVVDGDSSDASPGWCSATRGAMRACACRQSAPHRAVRAQRCHPAARGDVICRIDGHTRVATDYVRIGVETLRRTGADNVGGRMDAIGGGWFGNAVADATASRFGVGSYFHFGAEEREVDTVYLGMWPRQVFERIGLFDEELVRNQDDELNYRLRKAGGRVVLNPAMRSWYQNRQDVAHLVSQYYQYGQWKVRVLQKHPRQMSWRHFVPPTFVAGMMALSAASGVWPAAGGPLRLVTAAYLAGVLGAAVQASWRRGPAGVLATALALVCLHVSWGSGFLHGLVMFAGRWRGPEPSPPRLEHRGGDAAWSTAGQG
ncbi:MAG: glycosyltransferase family 2 protein [Candidatus Binatia bacterium]